jgi:hypothetical protein
MVDFFYQLTVFRQKRSKSEKLCNTIFYTYQFLLKREAELRKFDYYFIRRSSPALKFLRVNFSIGGKPRVKAFSDICRIRFFLPVSKT